MRTISIATHSNQTSNTAYVEQSRSDSVLCLQVTAWVMCMLQTNHSDITNLFIRWMHKNLVNLSCVAAVGPAVHTCPVTGVHVVLGT